MVLACVLVPLVAVSPGQAQTQKAPPPPSLDSLVPATPPADLRVPADLVPNLPPSSSTPSLDRALDTAPVPASFKAGVELLERRTEKSKTFTGDRPGQFKTELYAGAKHYRDARGNWVDIDADLGASKDGKRHNKSNSFDLAIAESSADAALANVALDAGHSVGFALEGAAKVQGKADKASVTYANTHKDTDVRLTSGRMGLKDELVLKSRAAPDRFVFPLTLKGLSASIESSGDIVYTDENGNERARTPHGFMTDAAVDERSGVAPKSWGVTYALIPYKNGQAIEVRVDRAWLDDPARVYPVTVDPEIKTGAGAGDTYASSAYPNTNTSYETTLNIGTYNSGGDVREGYVRFDTTPLTGAYIEWAALVMAERSSWDCNRQPGPVYRVTSDWNGRTLTWNNQPSINYTGYAGVMAGMNACPNRSGVWEIRDVVAHWAANPTQNFGLSIRTNSYDNLAWKTWSTTEGGGPPRLDVTYNYAPAVPSNVKPVDYGRVIQTAPVASATYSDPNNGNPTPGYVGFLISDQANNPVGGWNWSGQVCSGCTASVTLPTIPENWYKLTAISFDGQFLSAAVGPTWVFFDAHPPNTPTELRPVAGSVVTNPITVSARYSEYWGFPGSLLFWVNNTAGQAVAAVWKSDPNVPNDPQVCNGCIGTTALPHLNPGTYDLYVYGYDGALSPVSSPQRITVTDPPPTPPSAPTNLVASSTYGAATATWSPPLSNGNATISGYTVIAIDESTGSSAGQVVVCGTCSSGTVDGLSNGHSYILSVYATNSAGSGVAAVAGPTRPGFQLCTQVAEPCVTGIGELGFSQTSTGFEFASPSSDLQVKFGTTGAAPIDFLYSTSQAPPPPSDSTNGRSMNLRFEQPGPASTLGPLQQVAEDTLVADAADGTWRRSFHAAVGGVITVDTLNSSSAPAQFRDTINLPTGWSMQVETDTAIRILNDVGQVVGQLTAPIATDANGAVVAVERVLDATNQLLTDVLHTVTGLVYPITVDPYRYIGGNLSGPSTGRGNNEFYMWSSDTYKLNHYHKEYRTNPDGTQSIDFKYVQDAEVNVSIRQNLDGSLVRNVLTAQLFPRPAGYDSRMALRVIFRCKINLAGKKDPFCPDQQEDFVFDNRDKPTEWRSLYTRPETRQGSPDQAIAPVIRVPDLPDGVNKQRSFFEVYIRPYVPDGNNGELVPGDNTGRLRTYDVTCLRTTDGKRCFFDKNEAPGKGG